MEKFIKVTSKEDEPHEDVPLNDDGALSLSILQKYFPRATGLKYFSDTDVSHEIDLDDDRFYPPLGLWGDLTYYCISLEGDDDSDVKSDQLCIEDIRCIDEDDRNDLNMVHISINSSQKSKKKSYRPKGKYKKRKPHKCEICGKCFRNQNYMETHKLLHTGERPHACTHCDERFIRQDLLRIHARKVHDISCRAKQAPVPRSPNSKRDKPRTDDLYYFAAVKKRKYTRRKSQKNGEDGDEEEKTYECVTCAVKFISKAALKKHPCISTQTQFTCEECHQTFTKLNKLRLHLYKCHADEKVKKSPVKSETPKPIPMASKSKPKCKYASNDVKQEPSDVESSDDDVSYWDYMNENQHNAYKSKCNCVPNFNIVKYIEDKIPPEILTKFRYCKQNNIPWTGFLGYSALYKFWSRIVNDNPSDSICSSTSTEIVHILEEDVNEDESYTERVADYLMTEEVEEVGEATAESTSLLKGMDDLIKFN